MRPGSPQWAGSLGADVVEGLTRRRRRRAKLRIRHSLVRGFSQNHIELLTLYIFYFERVLFELVSRYDPGMIPSGALGILQRQSEVLGCPLSRDWQCPSTTTVVK
jgi:hypothetical protein